MTESKIIRPTVGRVVLFMLGNLTAGFAGSPGAPHAALVTHVHGDHCVNLCVFDAVGRPFPRESVPLVQPGGDVPGGDYCCWMPYQIGQAEKDRSADSELVLAFAALQQRVHEAEQAIQSLELTVATIAVNDLNVRTAQASVAGLALASTREEAVQHIRAVMPDVYLPSESRPELREQQTISEADVGDVGALLDKPKA
jgi:hypothetical protein